MPSEKVLQVSAGLHVRRWVGLLTRYAVDMNAFVLPCIIKNNHVSTGKFDISIGFFI